MNDNAGRATRDVSSKKMRSFPRGMAYMNVGADIALDRSVEPSGK
jgi:hypothetical protein